VSSPDHDGARSRPAAPALARGAVAAGGPDRGWPDGGVAAPALALGEAVDGPGPVDSEARPPSGSVPGPPVGHRAGSAYTPVLATLAYAVDRSTNQVLLIFKDSGRGDTALSKYNGVGGKLEPGETVVAGMLREFTEETGLTATRHRLRGTVSWPGFGANGESWFGFVFRVDEWTGQLAGRPSEGHVGWFSLDRLLNLELPLWPGDRHFLPLVFDDAVEQFHGVLPYENGQPVEWKVDVVPTAASDRA